MFPSMGTNPRGQVSATCSSGTEVAVPYPASSLDFLMAGSNMANCRRFGQPGTVLHPRVHYPFAISSLM